MGADGERSPCSWVNRLRSLRSGVRAELYCSGRNYQSLFCVINIVKHDPGAQSPIPHMSFNDFIGLLSNKMEEGFLLLFCFFIFYKRLKYFELYFHCVIKSEITQTITYFP